MNLPLNEWSVELRDESFIGNDSWNRFESLVKILTEECDVQKILFTKDDLSILNGEIFALQSRTARQRLLTFSDKYFERYYNYPIEDEFICPDEYTLDKKAVLLTMAYKENIPSVSILYDDTFSCNSFKACCYNVQKGKVSTVVLQNLHIGNWEEYEEFFFIGVPSSGLNPRFSPIWNLGRTRKFCEALPSLDGLSKEEKNSIFISEGSYVANLNGWVEDRRLSSINSKALNKIRHVFRPVKFKHQDAAYLSIDIEKRAFELLDRKGRHVMEISYLGDKTSGYKPNHDIILKG